MVITTSRFMDVQRVVPYQTRVISHWIVLVLPLMTVFAVIAIAIQCDDCDRSWHKTCVGIDKDTDPLTLGFTTCTKCGGADPEGMTLEKKRKVPHCDFCHEPKKGNDHKHCKAAKEQAANAYRTPMCNVLQSSVHPVAFTNFHEPDKTRACRKRRKRRVHGKVVSAEEYLDRKSRL